MEILIGYLKKFDYIDDYAKTTLSPEPIVGQVYRIIKVPQKGKNPLYQLYIGKESNSANMDSIFLGESLSGNYNDKWDFDIELVTKDNYLDFTITGENLVSLKKWLDSDNTDIKTIIKKAKGKQQVNVLEPPPLLEEIIAEQAPLERAISKLTSKAENIDTAMKTLETSINNMLSNDIDLVIGVSDSLEFINRFYVEEAKAAPSLNKQYLFNSKNPDAAIFNILSHVHNYSSDYESKKPFNKIDLYMAIYYCLLEIQRRNYQDTQDK